jgi:SAM-dependent methyltransferase
VQLGLAVDPAIIFPPDYPYTSGTTKLLRDNFADLYAEATAMLRLEPPPYPPPTEPGLARVPHYAAQVGQARLATGEGKGGGLVVDIGSNDGTLLANFKNAGHRVLGIEPTDVGKIAAARGIPTLARYFTPATAAEVCKTHGPARLVTAANCFAHIEDVHAIVEGILHLLAPDGVFISESHYLIALMERLQYDTIYHEHLRYYSLTSLANLLQMHGLEVFHARPIPTHGGSMRVYAARAGVMPVNASVAAMLAQEPRGAAMRARLDAFARAVMLSKLRLLAMIRELKESGARICGISAPSRASTLVNYAGLDEAIIDYVCEIAGSLKIGKCMPGTAIPVVEESRLFTDQPDAAIVFSWHIADELAPKLRAKGYRGKLISPLPAPREL